MRRYTAAVLLITTAVSFAAALGAACGFHW